MARSGPTSNRRFATFSGAANGNTYPLTGSVLTGDPVVFDPAASVGGAAAADVLLTVPASGAGFQTIAASAPLIGFAPAVTVQPGTTALLLAGGSLATVPTGIVACAPVVVATFGSGSVAASAALSLAAGTYAAPRVTVTLGVYAPGAAPAQTLRVRAWALLVGAAS